MLAYSSAVGPQGRAHGSAAGPERGRHEHATHAAGHEGRRPSACRRQAPAAAPIRHPGSRPPPSLSGATPGSGARAERRELLISHIPRRRRRGRSSASCWPSASSWPWPPPPRRRLRASQPIDPQEAEYQDDMTWDDYRTVPGTDWANPALVPTIEKWKVAFVLTEFADQPLNITMPAGATIFGNPQSDGEQHPAGAGGAVLRGLPQHAEPAQPLHDDEQLLDGDVAGPLRRRARGLRPVHADGQPVGVLAPRRRQRRLGLPDGLHLQPQRPHRGARAVGRRGRPDRRRELRQHHLPAGRPGRELYLAGVRRDDVPDDERRHRGVRQPRSDQAELGSDALHPVVVVRGRQGRLAERGREHVHRRPRARAWAPTPTS